MREQDSLDCDMFGGELTPPLPPTQASSSADREPRPFGGELSRTTDLLSFFGDLQLEGTEGAASAEEIAVAMGFGVQARRQQLERENVDVDGTSSVLAMPRQVAPDLSNVPNIEEAENINIIRSLQKYEDIAKECLGPAVAAKKELVRLGVGLLSILLLRESDISNLETVALVYWVEGGHYLRSHEGRPWMYSPSGAWMQLSGIIQQ